MQITAELSELVQAAKAVDLIPNAVTDIAGAPGAITAKVHVDELPGISAAVKMAARIAGAVDVTVTSELTESTLTFTIAASARGLNVSEQVAPVLTQKLRRLPSGLATVRTADGHTLVDFDLSRVGERAGMKITEVVLGETVSGKAVPLA